MRQELIDPSSRCNLNTLPSVCHSAALTLDRTSILPSGTCMCEKCLCASGYSGEACQYNEASCKDTSGVSTVIDQSFLILPMFGLVSSSLKC